MNVFQWIGNLFRTKSKPSVNSIFLTLISGEPFDVQSLSDDEKVALIDLLVNSPGRWDHRYACKECPWHTDILGIYGPCKKCGGVIDAMRASTKFLYFGPNIWIGREKYLQILHSLKEPKEEPKSTWNGHGSTGGGW